MIHRLLEGGAVRIVTLPPLLEGDHIILGPSLTEPKLEYVQGCQDLNAEVRMLHDLARSGVIGMETAERQLNTYLLAAAHTRLLSSLPQDRKRWLLFPIADAPYYGLIPDLGMIIHQVLSRDPVHSAISAVVEQCIPSMRHVCRAVQYTDSQEVLLNLVLALLLGLFPGSPKKPGFLARALLWARVHAVLTSSRETQTAFLTQYQDVVHLACMEYIARVGPAYLPAQDVFLTGKDAVSSLFFKRVPPVCDEFRQFLDDAASGAQGPSWQVIQELCATNMERISRLKRAHPYQPANDPGKRLTDGCKPSAQQIPAHWEVPRLLSDTPSADEYRLLGLSLGLHGPLIMQIQRDVQISLLPRNLAHIQYERLLELSRGESRIAHLRTRRHAEPDIFVLQPSKLTACVICVGRYICMHCSLTHKIHHAPRLRLDTLQQTLVCASCMRGNLIQVDMLGRILRFRQQHFYLCPICVSVQQYKGQGEQPWCPPSREPVRQNGVLQQMCPHMPARALEHHVHGRKKIGCFICTEPALMHTIDRVDHLTGRMQQFYYCQRHMPRAEVLIHCVNARQMAAYNPIWRRGPSDV